MDNSVKSIISTASNNSTIDMSYIGKDVWIAQIDTESVFENVKLINIPHNLTEIQLGSNISKSLVSPLKLPPTINVYIGPIFEKMELPETLRTIHLIETNGGICLSRFNVPSNVTDLTIETMDKMSKVDEIKFPNGLKTLNIKGPFNSSIERLKHFDFIVTAPEHLRIVDSITKSTETNDFSGSVIISTSNVNNSIRRYVPDLNHLKVNLNDEVPSISHIWLHILLEGLVQVKTLSVDSTNSISTLTSMGKVFDRSYVLGRPLCKNLFINNINFNESMTNLYLVMSKSLVRIGNINISIHHTNDVNLKGIVKRMAYFLNMNYVNGIYYSLFGSIESTIHINRNTIIIKRGQVHRQFKTVKREEHQITKPESSSMIVPIEDIIGIPPEKKKILLISWTKCGFCVKQEEIIKELKLKPEGSLIDEKIEIEIVDDPNKVSDKRINSFPSWIVNGEIQAGVKDEEAILKLLN